MSDILFALRLHVVVCIAVSGGGGGVICGACWISMCYFRSLMHLNKYVSVNRTTTKDCCMIMCALSTGFVCAKSLHKQSNASIIFET